MAPSSRKLLLLLPGLLTVGAVFADAPEATAPAAAAAPAPALRDASCKQPIKVDAVSSQVDYKTSTVDFKQVVISQCATRVQADHAHATGLDFANSRWTFDGNVHIDAAPRGNLRSDQAVVEFRDNHIARATITGKPAEFEQERTDTGQLARGHADQIVYDVGEGTVRLTDNAALTDGRSEVSGALLVYNIRAQSLQAGSESGANSGVHLTIQPGVPPAPGKGEVPKAPSEGAKPRPKPDAQQ